MVIDRDQFRDNFEFFDKEIVLDIINMFIDEYPQRISKIKQDIEEKNFEELKFDAHSLKGVVSNFMAEEARLAAKHLEDKGTNRDPENLDELYNILVLKNDLLIAELTDLKKEFV